MLKLLHKLWNQDEGALYATEWVLIAGIAVFGIIPGLVAIRNGTNTVLATQANALLATGTNFSFAGFAIVVGSTTVAFVSGVSVSNTQNFFQSSTGPVFDTNIGVNPAP